ncbi:hypothetical protein, partial [Marinicauda pacifica]|uniref:hypothetical protein n=1 Tax=Marinicauda pacifica TaxID=1133559 RepID=UPI0035C80BF2
MNIVIPGLTRDPEIMEYQRQMSALWPLLGPGIRRGARILRAKRAHALAARYPYRPAASTSSGANFHALLQYSQV